MSVQENLSLRLTGSIPVVGTKKKKEINSFMKIIDLFEKFNWAFGSNIKHAENPTRQKGNVIVWLNAKEVLNLIDPDWKVSPIEKTNHIGSRMDKAEKHLTSGGWMDPPDISVTSNPKYPISIGNGRHRIAALLKIGEEWFPANVSKTDVKKLTKYLTVKDKQ